MTNERTAVNETFRELHESGCFVMPNPWDVGSAKILQSLGFQAIATTSAGHAASLGRLDQQVTLDELIGHVADLAAAVSIPLNVDSERCFADTPSQIGAVVDAIADAGAAGFSIEDYDPATETIDPMDVAVERVAAAAEAARRRGLVLTARSENHLYGVTDLDDTIRRLTEFRQAGADVVYAPGLVDIDDIARVVREVGIPVNVLAWPGGPTVDQLAAAGVRRVSAGSALARAAYGALIRGAVELLEDGTSEYSSGAITDTEIRAAFVD